nr:hypothetical protein [uncultured Celeribacter sp.]
MALRLQQADHQGGFQLLRHQAVTTDGHPTQFRLLDGISEQFDESAPVSAAHIVGTSESQKPISRHAKMAARGPGQRIPLHLDHHLSAVFAPDHAGVFIGVQHAAQPATDVMLIGAVADRRMSPDRKLKQIELPQFARSD